MAFSARFGRELGTELIFVNISMTGLAESAIGEFELKLIVGMTALTTILDLDMCAADFKACFVMIKRANSFK